MAYTLLSTADAALRLGCSAERVRQLEREGKLPAEKMPGGQRVFKAEDVERIAKERADIRNRKTASAKTNQKP
jgi:excisionase family DNA binding protein